jgi:hypothetical protein
MEDEVLGGLALHGDPIETAGNEAPDEPGERVELVHPFFRGQRNSLNSRPLTKTSRRRAMSGTPLFEALFSECKTSVWNFLRKRLTCTPQKTEIRTSRKGLKRAATMMEGERAGSCLEEYQTRRVRTDPPCTHQASPSRSRSAEPARCMSAGQGSCRKADLPWRRRIQLANKPSGNRRCPRAAVTISNGSVPALTSG